MPSPKNNSKLITAIKKFLYTSRIDSLILTYINFFLQSRVKISWSDSVQINVTDMYLTNFFSLENWAFAAWGRNQKLNLNISIHSWDNITSKGRIPGMFDTFFVWGEHMKEELISYYPAIKSNKIHETGSIQFDFHKKKAFYESKNEFYLRQRIPMDSNIIIYAASTPSLGPDEHLIVEKLLKKFPDMTLYLRVHPKDDGKRYLKLKEKYENLLIDHPNKSGLLKEWDCSKIDIKNLVNSIRYCKAVITMGSTMVLDAMIHDKPVILVNFSCGKLFSPGRYNYHYSHYIPVMQDDSAYMAGSINMVETFVSKLLRGIDSKKSARENTVNNICGKQIGRSSQKIAECFY